MVGMQLKVNEKRIGNLNETNSMNSRYFQAPIETINKIIKIPIRHFSQKAFRKISCLNLQTKENSIKTGKRCLPKGYP
jgi:hypothetical protein